MFEQTGGIWNSYMKQLPPVNLEMKLISFIIHPTEIHSIRHEWGEVLWSISHLDSINGSTPKWRGVRRLPGAEASTELGAREFDHLCESHEAIQAMRRKNQLGKS